MATMVGAAEENHKHFGYYLNSNDGIPPQYWTSSILLNILHNTDVIPHSYDGIPS